MRYLLRRLLLLPVPLAVLFVSGLGFGEIFGRLVSPQHRVHGIGGGLVGFLLGRGELLG